ncbi:hypothetical protein THAOC_08986, partial [Thalassiosira oceanica]
MDLWYAALIRSTSSLPRIAKSNLGRAVVSRPLTFLLVEESRRETSAGSVWKNQMGRVRSRLLLAFLLVEEGRRRNISSLVLKNRLGRDLSCGKPPSYLPPRRGGPTSTVGELGLETETDSYRRRTRTSTPSGTACRAVLLSSSSSSRRVGPRAEEDRHVSSVKSDWKPTGTHAVRAASRDVCNAPRADALKLASTKDDRLEEQMIQRSGRYPTHVAAWASQSRASAPTQEYVVLRYSLSSYESDEESGLRGKPKDRKAWTPHRSNGRTQRSTAIAEHGRCLGKETLVRKDPDTLHVDGPESTQCSDILAQLTTPA